MITTVRDIVSFQVRHVTKTSASYAQISAQADSIVVFGILWVMQCHTREFRYSVWGLQLRSEFNCKAILGMTNYCCNRAIYQDFGS